MRRMISFHDFDWVLLSFVLIICACSVIEVYSTTYGTKFAGAHIKQIYWIIGGLILMFRALAATHWRRASSAPMSCCAVVELGR